MSTVDELPPFALITFPPFPRSQGEISYSVWKTKGIWIVRCSLTADQHEPMTVDDGLADFRQRI